MGQLNNIPGNAEVPQVGSSTAGNLVQIDGSNNIQDAGVKVTDLLQTATNFYLQDDASDIGGGYLQATNTPSATAEVQLTALTNLGAGTHLMNVFITNTGIPGKTELFEGVITASLKANKISGGKNVQLQFEFFTRTTGGVETVHVTSALSDFVTASNSRVFPIATQPNATIAETDRWGIKVYAVVSGGGSNVDIALQIEGAFNANWKSPTVTGIVGNHAASHVNGTDDIQSATAAQKGLLTAADWNTFNGKQNALGFTPENSANKGVANGYASLDAGGKVPSSQLPLELMEFKGNWDASLNSPALANTDVGAQGNVYRVSVAGSVDFGAGAISFDIGDWVFNNGTIWDKGDNTDQVASVFGRTGAVTAQSGDYTATQVSNTPAGNIAATDVQAAINELDSEKEPTFTKNTAFNKNFGTGASDVCEGNDARLSDQRVPTDNSATNAKLADMAQDTIKGRISVGTGDPEDLTAAQVRTITSTETSTQLDTRDTNNRARANHTGTQAFSTITGTVPINQGGSGQITQQAAIDALTNVSAATNEHVLTKDTASGNAVWKAATGAASIFTKASVNLTHASFTAAATSETINLFSLPAGAALKKIVMKTSTAFAGTGITAWTLEVGISGSTDKYATAFDVFQAVGDTVLLNASNDAMENWNAATQVTITARSTGGNLSASTAGVVDVYYVYEQIK